MQKKIYYWIYFIIGAIANFSIVLLPFFYIYKGMNTTQIGLLLSASYLAALLQPYVGYISDTKYGPKKILKVVSLFLIFISIFLFLSNTFLMLFIFSLLFSICRNVTFPLVDNISLDWCKENGVLYGSIRQGGSIGFGIGALLGVPFVLLFNPKFLIFLPLLLSIILFYLIKNISYEVEIHPDHKGFKLYKTNFKELMKNKLFIILIIIHLLLMGLSTLKLSYQSALLSSLNAPIYFIVLLNFFTIVPEIFLISKTEKFFKNTPIYIILIFPILLNILHAFILFKSSSLPIILISSFLHGLSMSIYLPNFFAFFNKAVPEKLSSTAFIINGTSQTINSLLINTFVIVPFITINGLRMSFLILIITMSINFISLYILFKITKKREI